MPDDHATDRRTLIRSAAGLTLASVAAAPATATLAEAMATGRFAGKNILITGGSSGIGRAGARRVAAEGGRVIVTGQTPAHLDAVRRELPADAIVLRNDAGDPAAVAALVDAARSLGRLDAVWLNAGYANIGTLETVTAASFERMMGINTRGPMLQLAALSPLLRQGAAVLVTASSSAYEGGDVTSLYGATKGAHLAMVRSWARQLAGRRIRVNTLVPGPIDTRIRRHLSDATRRSFEKAVVDLVPLGRMGTADEAASVALFLLSAESSFVTASQVAVDGGMMMR